MPPTQKLSFLGLRVIVYAMLGSHILFLFIAFIVTTNGSLQFDKREPRKTPICDLAVSMHIGSADVTRYITRSYVTCFSSSEFSTMKNVIANEFFEVAKMYPVVHFNNNLLNIPLYALFGATGVVILMANLLPDLLMRRLSSTDSDDELLQGYRISKIVQHALLETIGIFGLVLILLSGSPICASFMLGAVLLHLLFFPWITKHEDLRRLVE